MHWNIHVDLHQSVDMPLRSTKTCWWSFLSSKWQRSSSFSLVLTDSTVAKISSTLFCSREFCQCIFTALAASINLQSRRLHRSIQWFKWFDNSFSHSQGHHVTGSWNRQRRLAASPDISMLRADYEFLSVFRITTYWLRETSTAGKQTSHRVGHITVWCSHQRCWCSSWSVT